MVFSKTFRGIMFLRNAGIAKDKAVITKPFFVFMAGHF